MVTRAVHANSANLAGGHWRRKSFLTQALINLRSYQNDTVRKLDELILRGWHLYSIRVIFNYTKWVGPKSSHTICFSIYMWKGRLQSFLIRSSLFCFVWLWKGRLQSFLIRSSLLCFVWLWKGKLWGKRYCFLIQQRRLLSRTSTS